MTGAAVTGAAGTGGGVTGGRVLRWTVTGQARYVVIGGSLAVGHQAGEALVPVVIGVIVDEAVATGSTTELIRWLSVLALVFAGLSVSYRFAARAGERATEQAAHRIRHRLTARVLAPYGGAEAGHLPGALVSVATGDAARVGAVNLAITAGVAALAALSTAAVVLLRISLPLGLLILLGAPPMLWAAHLIGRPLQRRSAMEQERAAQASGVAADLVAGLRILKGIGAEPAARDRYRRISRRSLSATLRAANAHAWHDGALLAVTGVFIAAVALVGARLAVAGDISLGDLVAAVGLALFLLGPLSLLTWVNGQLAQARASAARIAIVLSAPPAVPPGGAALPDPVRGELLLRDVAHGPLRVGELRVAPGELVGVVAPEPAVAAALLRCLAREGDPERGTIALDGVSLAELDPARVRDAILTATHDATLFDGTVAENVLAVGGPGAAIEPVLAATRVDELASGLPDGLRTPVGERGRSLSGGQRQRVALARALAADPPVLVLHDPTTAVDAVTEAHIATRLRRRRAGHTTILVTTSPALLAVTDRVVLLPGTGDPVMGRHEDLLQSHTGYRSAVLG